MMKKNPIFVFLGLISLLLPACEKELTQLPITDKTSAQFFSTETEVEEAISGVYATLQSNSLYGQNIPAMGEIPSDNTFDQVPANDNGFLGQLDQFTTSSSNGLLSDTWLKSYVGIQRANVVLNRIDNVPYKVDSVKTARKGEAKFVRALLYFNLVRLFGDVPLVIKETSNPNVYFGQGRTPANQVYDQIKKDLSEAIDQVLSTTSQPGRATKGAAQALLAKVYLTLGDYANAEAQLLSVYNSGRYALLASPSLVFAPANEISKEILFSVQFASGINGNTEGSTMFQQFSPSGTQSGAKGHNLPTASLYQLYTALDLRKDTYVDTARGGVPYCKKLVKPTTVIADGGSDIVVLRYADVLLMLAEIKNEQGNTVDAALYLNQVRNRAGLSDATVLTQAEMRAAIDLERRLELIGEGHRWFDLLRTNAAIGVMNGWFKTNNINITIDQHHLLLPLPQDQINTDPSIIQNKDY